MPASSFVLDTISEGLGTVVARNGAVRDSGDCWLNSHEVVHDSLDNGFTVRAALHPGEARDAARDLLDGLAAHGLAVHRQIPRGGNSLSARLLRLVDELADATGDVDQVGRIADALSALAVEARHRDDAVVPAYLRQQLPAGMARLVDHRRRALAALRNLVLVEKRP
ncbi:hypothetical protein [Paracraurococcus lichenis]|uniref:Uncharacterized protein n=1 Tax=Paracraurococcus lichenis TaxID=3064888 RepID=A0ABT9EBQ9_9PROT|nr:hypothetical protein [Paracraurococcus sp. LOR1-02]MDO9713641.1 hypothetical protein [Paracraurococcus sp. LOR1-02]